MATPRILTRNGLDNKAPSGMLHAPTSTESGTAFPTADFVARMIEIVGTELGGIGKEMKDKNKRINELLSESNTKDGRIRELNDTCFRLRTALKTRANELKKANAKLEQATTALAEESRVKDDLMVQCKDLRVSLDKAKQTPKPSVQNEHLEAQLRAELGRAQQETRDLRGKCAELTRRNDNLLNAAWRSNQDLHGAQEVVRGKHLELEESWMKMNAIDRARGEALKAAWDAKAALRIKEAELQQVQEENVVFARRVQTLEKDTEQEKSVAAELRRQLQGRTRKVKTYNRCRRCAASEGLNSESDSGDGEFDGSSSEESDDSTQFSSAYSHSGKDT